jgi:hypothetical protein
LFEQMRSFIRVGGHLARGLNKRAIQIHKASNLPG